MQTVVGWAVFGVFVWIWLAGRTADKEDGKGRIRGPVFCIGYGIRAARSARNDEGPDNKDPGLDTEGDTTRVATATQPPSRGRDTTTNPQDTGRDTRHDMSRVTWRDSVRDALDVVFRGRKVADEPVSPVTVAEDPPSQAQTVTVPESDDQDEDLPVRVINVPPGTWSGTTIATEPDGTRVILKFEPAPIGRPPAKPVERHPEQPPLTEWLERPRDPEDEDGPDTPTRAAERAARQDWLRALEANERFTSDEVTDMYYAKFGVSRRTLQRDRSEIAARRETTPR